MNYRYYLTQRPISLGTCPKGFIDFENFSEKTYIDSIGCEAWGWVLYEEPLQIEELLKWEMIYGGEINV